MNWAKTTAKQNQGFGAAYIRDFTVSSSHPHVCLFRWWLTPLSLCNSDPEDPRHRGGFYYPDLPITTHHFVG